METKEFWNGKKVFLTGHTGFKGSWLSLWLSSLGAEVFGYALEPPTEPSMFEVCKVGDLIESTISDVRDIDALKKVINNFSPDIAIHMAAQALVRESFENPVETYAINVMGTVNFFEALRESKSVRAIVNVTTDKCYENKEWDQGYKETDRLGGYDPYSNSKACSELVTDAFRNSFFNIENYSEHKVALASARAGNVIGGGDWAIDRLVADFVRSVLECKELLIRNPCAIRPWQHVLEPLDGYMKLAQALYESGPLFAKGWNFGPNDSDARDVEYVVDRFCSSWGGGASYKIDKGEHPHEATYLKLDCTMARSELNWSQRLNIGEAIDLTVDWVKAYKNGSNMRNFSLKQINEYMKKEI